MNFTPSSSVVMNVNNQARCHHSSPATQPQKLLRSPSCSQAQIGTMLRADSAVYIAMRNQPQQVTRASGTAEDYGWPFRMLPGH